MHRFVSVCDETQSREDIMESANQTHAAPTEAHGGDSHEDKTQGLTKADRRKKEGARRELRPRKLRRVKQGYITTRTLQSKQRRKRKAAARQARKTIRLKTKRFQREKKKRRQFVIRLPVEIRLPAELLPCGGLCQKIQ